MGFGGWVVPVGNGLCLCVGAGGKCGRRETSEAAAVTSGPETLVPGQGGSSGGGAGSGCFQGRANSICC